MAKGGVEKPEIEWDFRKQQQHTAQHYIQKEYRKFLALCRIEIKGRQ